MAKPRHYTRPTFDQALTAWRELLASRGLPEESLWVFEENFCFERDPSSPQGFRLGFQTALTPPPPGAERIAFHYFSDFEAPVVFYRAGSCGGKSISTLLCDPWFETKSDADGYLRREDWLMAFRPGGPQPIEEITDAARWGQRMVRSRPLHELDFCLTLRAIHETLAHGRVLTTYERFALRLLHAWRRLLHPSTRGG